MNVKIIKTEVQCESNFIGRYLFRIPVYTESEILSLRNAFITKFGVESVEWLTFHGSDIRENIELTDWLRTNILFYNAYGIATYDTFYPSGSVNESKLSAMRAYATDMNMAVDITADVMSILPGAHDGGDNQYQDREITLTNIETGETARYIHRTYDPSISSTGTHMSLLFTASAATGYGFGSSNMAFGVGSRLPIIQVNIPYLVYSDDYEAIIGYGTHYNDLPGGSYASVSVNTLFTNNTAGYVDISNVPAMVYPYFTSEGQIVDPDYNGDPYSEGGITGTGGGTGTFSGTGDVISIPSLPTLSATSAGFITLFNPTAAQMASLAAYMWTGAFDLDTFKKIFADPMDCILGLSIVPVNVSAGGSAEVKVGNIGTGISMTKAASQYVEVDCGTLNVEEFWGAYLDYDPYTKAEIYLPYIGTHPIAVDDIMGKSVHVVYHVDILSGACIAYIQCSGTVLYSFIGQCSSSIPISGNDWTNVVNGVLSIAGAVGSMVASGGATAPMVLPGIASAAANSMKPTVEKSGSLSGTGGMMGVQTPYLILTRPRQALPKNQNSFTGYPSFITELLGNLSGYTEIEEIHLENMTATDGEIAEIIGLLKGGVIL